MAEEGRGATGASEGRVGANHVGVANDERDAGAASHEIGAGAVRSAAQPGLREVLLVAAGVVATVLVAAAVTSLLPPEGRSLVTDTPLAIVVLLVVTVAVLVRVGRGGAG